MRAPERPGPVGAALVEEIRKLVPAPGPDRFLSPDIKSVVGLVADGTLLSRARSLTSVM